MQLDLHIPGEPVGKGTFSPKGATYQIVSSKARKYIKLITDTARVEVEKQGWIVPEKQCPVFVVIHAFFAIPKSWPKYKREAVKGWAAFIGPDHDNIAKSVNDALQGKRVAARTREGVVVVEDSAISGPSNKWFTEGEAYTHITVTYDEAQNREVKSCTQKTAK